MQRLDGAWTVSNNAVFKNNDDFNVASGLSYNASDDDDDDGANNIDGHEVDADWTTDFAGAATGDFTLLVGSPLFITGGVDNPGAGLYSTDIAGTAYVSTWPIGVFQPGAAPAVGLSLPIAMAYYNRIRRISGD